MAKKKKVAKPAPRNRLNAQEALESFCKRLDAKLTEERVAAQIRYEREDREFQSGTRSALRSIGEKWDSITNALTAVTATNNDLKRLLTDREATANQMVRQQQEVIRELQNELKTLRYREGKWPDLIADANRERDYWLNALGVKLVIRPGEPARITAWSRLRMRLRAAYDSWRKAELAGPEIPGNEYDEDD